MVLVASYATQKISFNVYIVCLSVCLAIYPHSVWNLCNLSRKTAWVNYFGRVLRDPVGHFSIKLSNCHARAHWLSCDLKYFLHSCIYFRRIRADSLKWWFVLSNNPVFLPPHSPLQIMKNLLGFCFYPKWKGC